MLAFGESGSKVSSNFFVLFLKICIVLKLYQKY